MPYTPIVGTLGFIVSPDRRHTLLVHRTARLHDHHLGKFNGLGGKMRPDEDVLSCMRREILEESGLRCTSMRLRGTINWTGFGPACEDWLGFIFLVEGFEGEPFSGNSEGPLVWKRLDELDSLPMWEGDRFFLPLVFDGDPRPFHGVMPYQDGRPVSWSWSRL